MILQIKSEPSLAVNIPIMITPNLRHDPSILIDVKDFMPVVVSSTDKSNIRIHSSFSLATLDRDAGERLRDLVDFIQSSQRASIRVGIWDAPTPSPSRLHTWRTGRITHWNFASGELAAASW